MGKPAPIIYKEALAMLGLLGAQVVAIGDSLEHDIAGGGCGGFLWESAAAPVGAMPCPQNKTNWRLALLCFSTGPGKVVHVAVD